MKPGEWIGVISTAVILVSALLGSWILLEQKIAGLELRMQAVELYAKVARTELIQVIKDLHQLKGHHQIHAEGHPEKAQ